MLQLLRGFLSLSVTLQIRIQLSNLIELSRRLFKYFGNEGVYSKEAQNWMYRGPINYNWIELSIFRSIIRQFTRLHKSRKALSVQVGNFYFNYSQAENKKKFVIFFIDPYYAGGLIQSAIFSNVYFSMSWRTQIS